jgi:hypothetical protein
MDLTSVPIFSIISGPDGGADFRFDRGVDVKLSSGGRLRIGLVETVFQDPVRERNHGTHGTNGIHGKTFSFRDLSPFPCVPW